MRRKIIDLPEAPESLRVASMRPARYAPENAAGAGVPYHELAASMRPARYAPENRVVRDADLIVIRASMRPARYAPENSKMSDWSREKSIMLQ